MKKFSRPNKALRRLDLRPGMLVWDVYGVYPAIASEKPKMILEIDDENQNLVMLHMERRSDGAWEGSSIVGKLLKSRTNSFRDRNLVEDNSYNDNYLFASAEDAEAVRDGMNAMYNLYPEIRKIEEVRNRRIGDLIREFGYVF